VHGGGAVIDALTEALIEEGLRLAEPGEFTRRAFQNGKLDLSRAEAVGDLVDAETEAQRRQALDQLGGALARRYAAWRAVLVEALAVLEAAVDFPDDEVPTTVALEAESALAGLAAALDTALADAGRGEQVRDGYRVAVIGAPNAGKSSLLNVLVGREAAIVTPIPGTTRDVIEVGLILDGFRIWLSDTAGLRATEDVIEIEGVRRARVLAAGAALRLWVVDGAASDEAWREATQAVQFGDICLINKQDLGTGPAGSEVRIWAAGQGLGVVEASLSTGDGLAELKTRLATRVSEALTGTDFPAATRARHRRDLEEARAHLGRALEALSTAAPVELAAEDVRLAARALDKISGRIDPEDVLDRVFARFCIGK
jgi:tRNA modification GTPase